MAKHLGISGLVQGVGYRYSFEAQARALGISGWVRNRMDGSVEAAVSGTPDAMARIVAWAWCGPAGAQVADVAVADIDDARITPGRFIIMATE